MQRIPVLCVTFLCVMVLCSACIHPFSQSGNQTALVPLDDKLLAELRTGPALRPTQGRVLTDNDDAFSTKLNLIRSASRSIDLAYYILADDYSSSILSRELLLATERGVRVRMLLDYHSHYADLDRFRMLEHYGNQGSGSLEVRFYNRPSANVVKDAFFLTLGCGAANQGRHDGCSEAKFAQVDALFANEQIDGRPAAERNISNINSGNSGLFLSGLYAKNPELMAMAVSQGQDVDLDTLKAGSGDTSEEDIDNLKRLARLYWQANYGSGLDRLVNRIKLSAAFALHGEQIDPIHDTFSAFLPVERSGATFSSSESVRQARRDWQYLSDFLHHKFLLVDQVELVTGGRNVEDSYHMNPNPLSAKYTFMDVDTHLSFGTAQAALRDGFESLWEFDTMVADLHDVSSHAPNTVLVHGELASLRCQDLENGSSEDHQTCIDMALQDLASQPLIERLKTHREALHARADDHQHRYRALPASRRMPSFDIDSGALVSHVENLPFDRTLPAQSRRRLTGASNGAESASGKHIHALWLAAMKASCEQATVSEPVTIYMHNAYFFLPSNLLSALARMSDGREPCANTEIVILTNSMATTDLNVVNVLSQHSLKALFEHHAEKHDPQRGARLRYLEYRASDAGVNRSLHAKVMLFGEDIFIGSANADLRSYMMDTNNGLYIQQAPDLRKAYGTWLQSLIDDPERTQELNDWYLQTSHEQILRQGDSLVDSELAKYRAERFIQDPAQVSELKRRLREASQEVYRLSRRIVSDHGDSDAQARFNTLFKTI